MNSVQCLAIISVLIIRSLGLGMPVALAASSPLFCETGKQCVSSAPEGGGQTTYYPDKRSYYIRNPAPGRNQVLVKFVRQNEKADVLDFGVCDGAGCENALKPGVNGMLCMLTASGHGANPIDYNNYGDQACFDAKSLREGV